jgi:hypothetical protein
MLCRSHGSTTAKCVIPGCRCRHAPGSRRCKKHHALTDKGEFQKNLPDSQCPPQMGSQAPVPRPPLTGPPTPSPASPPKPTRGKCGYCRAEDATETRVSPSGRYTEVECRFCRSRFGYGD